jgi:uncharacterized protein (UPF0261 family)
LNRARGPAAFLFPLRRWSYIGRERGPLWDPEANNALRETVRGALRAGVRYVEVDAAINDPRFGDEAAAVACAFLEERGRSISLRAQAEGGVPC